MNITYARIKKLISNGNYDVEVLKNNLDTFLLAGRLTNEEYTELMALIDTDKKEDNSAE